MIKTKVLEVLVDGAGKLDERELGWCLMPEVPVEKKVPEAQLVNGVMQMPAPLRIQVNGEHYFIIGHSWDIKVVDEASVAPVPTMILFVQAPVKAPTLVRAPSGVLDVLGNKMPPPGGKRN